MFDLPHIERIDDEIDVSQGTIQPFDYGFITTWVGRRKTPFGHRLIRSGRIVGWICEGSSANKLLGELMHVKPWRKRRKTSTV